MLQVLAAVLSLAALNVAGDTSVSRDIAKQDEAVTHFAFGPKGKRLATASDDGLRVWDVKSGKLLWEVTDEMGGVAGLGFTEKGKLMLGGTGAALLWTFDDSGRALQTSAAPAEDVQHMVVDPEGRWAWFGGTDGMVLRLTPGESDNVSRKTFKNGGVTSLATDGSGKLVAVGGADDTIRTLSAAKFERDNVLKGHEGAVLSLAFDDKGTTLVSGGADHTVRLWNPRKGKLEKTLVGHKAAVDALAITTKKKWIASGDAAGRVIVWDLKRGELLAEFDAGAPVLRLAFHPDGKTLALVQGKTHVTLWNVGAAF